MPDILSWKFRQRNLYFTVKDPNQNFEGEVNDLHNRHSVAF